MSSKPPILVDLKFHSEHLRDALQTTWPDRGFIDLNDSAHNDPAHKDHDISQCEYALLWKPRADIFQLAPRLKVIFSGGAGVDHMIGMDHLPDVPIVRFVDPSLTTRMSEWVVMNCLMHLRRQREHQECQHQKIWGHLVSPEAREVTVGVMGLGILGQDAAMKLKVMGFHVIGWSRSKKEIDGIETFDAAQCDVFLAQTDILVGLLPLTPETTGFYDEALFRKLRRNGALGKPVFMNAGRGKSQAEADLIAALNNGLLGGASLDVFAAEPLSPDSPLWDMPQVFVTPHNAATSDEGALLRHVKHQIERFEDGKPLEFTIDRIRGY